MVDTSELVKDEQVRSFCLNQFQIKLKEGLFQDLFNSKKLACMLGSGQLVRPPPPQTE